MPRKGSKRRKNRTHIKPAPNAAPDSSTSSKVPKSFVVKSGTVGNSVAQLTKDVRKVLEPNTGTRLRERKSNRIRDYVSMSGPLGVTHLMVFSQPSSLSLPTPSTSSTPSKPKKTAKQINDEHERSLIEGTTTVNLRLIRLPRGPTLNFKILRYSLASDILRMARRPRSIGREFAEAPLLILSGFGGEDKQLKLMTTVFQNLFPPIHVQTMALSSARRVVLLSYNATTHTIDFRHFLISVRPVGVSKPIRKLIAGSTNNKAVPLKRRLEDINGGTSESEASDAEGEQKEIVKFRPVPSKKASGKAKGILDLSKASDISDYILRQEAMGFVTSDSEMSDMSDAGGSSAGSDSEADEKKGKVRLAGDYVGRGNRGKGVRGDKRAVRLVELGPRMEMGLVKIEEGVGEGEVLFHEMVHKTNREASELAKVHAARRKLAAERRAQQEANVAAKKAAKNTGGASKGDGEDEEEEVDEDNKIDSDIEFDYDKEHGLPVPSDEELDEDSEGEFDEDEEMEEDGARAPDSSAGESDEEENGFDEEWDDEDDSDTDPIPLSQAYLLDEEEEEAPRPKKPQPRRGNGPASFKQSQFKRFNETEKRGERMPAGLRAERPLTKKMKKQAEESEKKSGKKGDKNSYGEEREERGGRDSGGRGGSRGGRGGGRGGSSRGGGSRGGAGRGRGRGK